MNMMQKMHYDSKSLGQSCPGIRKPILRGPILPKPSSLHRPVPIQPLLHLPIHYSDTAAKPNQTLVKKFSKITLKQSKEALRAQQVGFIAGQTLLVQWQRPFS